MPENIQRLIYGKNNIERIVGCEVQDHTCELFIQQPDGSVKSEFKPNKYWLVASKPLDRNFSQLQGNQFYKYIKQYDNRQQFLDDRTRYYKQGTFSIWNATEAAQIKYGFTYFKGLKPEDVTVLSFDIETTTLEHNRDAKVLIIANTLRKNGKVIRKMFCHDQYSSQQEMINEWCHFVHNANPSVITGHNIVAFDLPYLNFVSGQLQLGRDGSIMKIDSRESKFRKDGSQSYGYHKIYIYGREIVDTFFLSIKYDMAAKKYDNYKLKNIIKQEGLEVKDRQFYDGDLIRTNYTITEEWEKIKKYAQHDGDDSLALFDLMAPSFFYFTRSIPKSFQSVVESATGSQLNALMIRSYLQEGGSLPLDSKAVEYEGAISLGNPGLYKNVFKVDVSSLYPSIILTHEIYDKLKDPEGNFLKIAKYFTEERLENKKLAKDTANRYYKDLEQSQKIAINSLYGFLGAPGLLYNSPNKASFITEKGRDILNKAGTWAEEKGFCIANADTDSISFTDNDQPISKERRQELLTELNSLYPDSIRWEDDGYFSNVLIVKVKNYYLETEDGKQKIKGSALVMSMKEAALKEFGKQFIQTIVHGTIDDSLALYNKYVNEILTLTDIIRWTARKTVTASVLHPERTNEQRVFDAIGDEDVQEGDKLNVYFKIDGTLSLQQNWCNDHDPYRLMEKLWKTVSVFSNVIDIKLFTKYHLKTKRKHLDELPKVG